MVGGAWVLNAGGVPLCGVLHVLPKIPGSTPVVLSWTKNQQRNLTRTLNPPDTRLKHPRPPNVRLL